MAYMSFDYNGKNSLKDFNTVINYTLELAGSDPDYTATEVPGRDGDVITSNGRDKSVSQAFSLTCLDPYPQSVTTLTNLVQWLRSDLAWHDFVLRDIETDYTRVGMVVAAVPVSLAEDYSTVTVTFNFEPRKYLTSGLVTVALKSGDTFNNSTGIVAKPRIVLTGKGDTDLTVGGSVYHLKGISEGVVIDSKQVSVTNLAGTVNQFNWYYSTTFPVLNPGANKINWTGSFTGTIVTRLAVVL